MAMANSNGGKTTGKKLTKDQAKLAQVVQRIGAVDRKPAKATASTSKKMSDVKKPTAKLPTGESPKKLSILARTEKSAARAGVGKGNEVPRAISGSEAATRAGARRDQATARKNYYGAEKPTTASAANATKKALANKKKGM